MDILYDEPVLNSDYMAYGHDYTPTTFGEEAGAGFKESYIRAPMSSIDRITEYAEAEVLDSPFLTEEEWKKSDYYREGLEFKDGVKTSVAKLVADRKDEEVYRQDIMRRAPKGIIRGGGVMAVDLAAQLADPINVASAFIPIVGEARFAAMTGKVGITAARAARGMAEGLVGAAMVEPFVLGASRQEQADYNTYDSMLAVGFGAGFGAGLHVGAGKLGDIMGITPYAKNKAAETALSQVLKGEKVEVSKVTYSGDTMGAEFRTDGPRQRAMNIAMESKTLTPENVQAAFSVWDDATKKVYARNAIDDVEDFYTYFGGSDKSVEPLIHELKAISKSFQKADINSILDDVGGMLLTIMERSGAAEISLAGGVDRRILLSEFKEYMRGTKAPSPDRLELLNKMKSWTLSIYETLNERGTVGFDEANPKLKEARTNVDASMKDLDTITARQEVLTSKIAESRLRVAELEDTLWDLADEPKMYKARKMHIKEAHANIKNYFDELAELNNERIVAEAELDTARKEYSGAKILSQEDMDMVDDIKRDFDEMLSNDPTPDRPNNIAAESLRPDDTVRTESAAFAEEVADRLEREATSVPDKVVDRDIQAYSKQIDEFYRDGIITQEEYGKLQQTVSEENMKLKDRKELISSVVNCVVGG